MRRLRWWLLAGCLAILVAVGLLAAGWLVVRAHGPAFTRERIEAALTEALGDPVRIAELRLEPWRGTLVVRELRAASALAPEAPWLRLERIEIRLGLQSLWRREIVVSRIRLEDLDLRLPAGEGGPPSASLLVPARVVLGPVTVTLSRLELVRGRFTYDDAATGRRAVLEGLAGTADPAAEHLDLRLRASAFRVQEGGATYAFDALEAQARLLADRVVLRTLRGRWKQRPLTVAGELFPLRDPVAGTLTVEAEADLAELARDAGLSLPVEGIAGFRGEIAGDLDRPRIAGRVTTQALAIGTVRAQAVNLAGRWADGRLTLEEVRGRAFSGELWGTGTLQPDRLDEARFHLAFSGVSLAALDPLLPAPLGMTGRLGGEADLAGDPRSPETLAGRIRLESAALRLPGAAGRLGEGAVTAVGRLDREVLTLEAGTARFPGVALSARGGLTPSGPRALHLEGDLDLGRLAALWDRRDLAGTARLALEAAGTWDRPEISGRLGSGDLALFGTRFTEVDIPLRLVGSALEVSPRLRLGRIRLGASGRLDWPDPLPPRGPDLSRDLRIRLAVQAPELFWEDLAAWLPETARGEGRLSLAAEVSGTPADWRATARLRAGALTGPHAVPIRDLAATLALDPGRIRLERLTASVHAVPLRGRGEWTWDGAGSAGVELGPAEIARLPMPAAGVALRGTAEARLTARTAPGMLEVSGAAVLQDGAVHGIPLGDGRIEASWRRQTVQARLEFPALSLEGTLRGRLDGPEPLGLRLQAEGMPLGPILQALAPPGTPPIEGTLSAVADLLAPTADPASLRGSLSASAIRLTVDGDPWENRGPIRLRWEAGRLFVDRLALTGRLGEAEATGSLEPGGPLDLQVRAALPLAVLPSFVPGVREAAGSLDVRLQAGGTWESPNLVGQGTLRADRIQLDGYPDAVRTLEAAFVATPQAIRLTGASALLGRSRLQATGDLVLEGWRPGPYRLALTVREMPFAPLEGLQTLWDLDLELVGSGAAARLGGQGRLLRGTYTGDFSLLGMLLSRRTAAGPAGPTFALPIRLALRLDDNLAVRTNLVQLRVGGALTVEGTAADPVLFGTLESRDGRIVFRRHRFVVESASARFTDPQAIDPVLRVVSRARIGAYDVTLSLSGTVQELAIRLASSPPLSQEQIVALITTGSPALTAGQAAQGLLLEEFGRLVLQDILGVVSDTTGLSRLQAGVSEGQEGQELQVGTQLTDEVRVIYWQTLSGGNKRLLRVEYQLLGPLFIAGEQDFQGGYGGDILLRLRIR